MSKILEFFLSSLLIAVFSVAFVSFSALRYVLRVSGIADCMWHGSAKAWVDVNGDGIINTSEPPLDGIEIYIDDLEGGLINTSLPVTTGTNGEVQFQVPIPDCSETTFDVSTEIPPGYRITTQPRIKVLEDFWASLIPQDVYYFGFMPER